ncbi:MAG TPA: molybdenum cofactor biosynthesis protein MoaE [Methylomirabilota bacterium]|nr:molybdenum cofactor biosynthesis protein MoaE [Methylomirabilota bacterium]
MDQIGLHSKGEVDLSDILESLTKHPNYRQAGAIASFIGVVREDPIRNGTGNVSHLEYEAYNEIALKKLEEIRQAMIKHPGIIEVSIHHIIDKLKVGEPSLLVAVLGKHRQEAFATLKETVERVKSEVPIWKKEFTEKGAYWVSTSEGS